MSGEVPIALFEYNKNLSASWQEFKSILVARGQMDGRDFVRPKRKRYDFLHRAFEGLATISIDLMSCASF